MTEIPPRLARRPRDKRGYPVPWNLLIGEDDTPLFTVNDTAKHLRAIQEQLCPLCGERLGRWRWFVGGPRSAFDPHGAYFDLPGHHECERFALQTCPWLAAPRYAALLPAGKMPRRDKVPHHAILLDPTMIPERPEVFVAVASDAMTLSDRLYVFPTRPYLAAEFWRHGRELPPAEALPFLRASLGAEWTIPRFRG